MASINIKKTPKTNINNPPSGSTSLYVNASGDLSLKDENGKTVTIGGYKVSNSVYPTGAYFSRVLEDSGNIQDLNKLTELYIKNLKLLDSTVFLWSGIAGMKTRQETASSPMFASKIYNMANKVQSFGDELVTNGMFTTDTSGWTAGGGATLSVDATRLKVTNTDGTNGGATQSITTEANKTYHLTYTFTLGAGNGQVRVGTALGGSELLLSPVLSANATRTVSFVATSTTTRLFFGCDSLVTTDFALFDNISVRQMDWVDGTNDAVQTTDANQPYVGGVIAPNEVRKIKHNGYNGTNIKKLSHNSFTIAGGSPVTAIYVLKLNKGGTSVQLINSTTVSSALRLGVNESRLSSTSYLPTGINVILEFTSDGGSKGVIKINGIKQPSTHNGGNLITFSSVSEDSSTPAFSFDGELIHKQIFNKALSEAESQAVHDYLRLQIPEIEGVAIGNQYWATSNYEGVVAGDGSVIPEVQAAVNVNIITNGDFVSSDISTWTNRARCTMTWNVGEYVEVVSTGTGDFAIGRSAVLTDYRNKWHKITFRAKSPNSTDVPKLLQTTHYTNILWIKRPALSTLWQEYEVLAYALNTDNIILYPVSSGAIIGTQVDIDDIVDQTVGWSQSTALYNAIYAQTTGSTAQKELAALKAAAMWCYYNNDVNNGAIYGKLYNWYAAKLIDLYPPAGYRVPSESDIVQLENYLGGQSVAWTKNKAVYGGAAATNESGMSFLIGGNRSDLGVFDSNASYLWLSTNSNATNAFRRYIEKNAVYIGATQDKRRGGYVRLLRNSPVGLNEKTITSTTIASDIASTANSTQIPFGYSVASIRLKTTANLTNIKVELWNNFYSGTPTLVSTLIAGKTANNTTMVFPVLADAIALLQDGTLRINATHNGGYVAGTETIVEYNLVKNTF